MLRNPKLIRIVAFALMILGIAGIGQIWEAIQSGKIAGWGRHSSILAMDRHPFLFALRLIDLGVFAPLIFWLGLFLLRGIRKDREDLIRTLNRPEFENPTHRSEM